MKNHHTSKSSNNDESKVKVNKSEIGKLIQLVLICIAKRLDHWIAPSTSLQELADRLCKVMDDLSSNRASDKQSQAEARGLGFFLLKLVQSGNAEGISIEESLSKYLIYLETIDECLTAELKLAYSNVLRDSTDIILDKYTPTNTNNNNNSSSLFEISRAFRLIWFENLMFSSYRLQPSSFNKELDAVFKNEQPKDVISKLIATLFDCYAVCLLRRTGQKYISLWKGFIVKRFPVIVKRLLENAGEQRALIEQAVCQPLMRLDRQTVNLLRISGGGDALDEMFDSFPSTTTDLRHEFLQACIQLEIISQDALIKTLGQDANNQNNNNNTNNTNHSNDNASNNSQGKAGTDFVFDVKSGTQISINEIFMLASHENEYDGKLEDCVIYRIISIFEEVDGIRQMKIANKLVKFVRDCCKKGLSKCLRRLCHTLALKLTALDVLFLHVEPAKLLQPLVKFLDSWKDDEDVMSIQDGYIDCGSILLLIVVAFKRYDLMNKEMAILKNSDLRSSFCLSVLTSSRPEVNDDLLGAWITALFDAGAISDDLMKSCSFQQVFWLVPLIFQQAITACSRNIIDFDVLKGGLDYFLQPFLLGTLLNAYKYLIKHLWEYQDAMVAIQVLNSLIVSPEVTDEALAINQMVLTVMSDELNQAIQDRKARGDAQLDQILTVLGPYVQQMTDDGTSPVNNGNTTNPKSSSSSSSSSSSPSSDSSLINSVKENIGSLVNWIQAIDQGISGPLEYNKSVIFLAVDIFGAQSVLKIMLDELDLSEAQGTIDYTLDVFSSLIVVNDTIPKTQINRNRLISKKEDDEYQLEECASMKLDSSILTVVLNDTEESILELRNKDITNTPKNIILGGFKKLKQRVMRLMKEIQAVPIYCIKTEDIPEQEQEQEQEEEEQEEELEPKEQGIVQLPISQLESQQIELDLTNQDNNDLFNQTEDLMMNLEDIDMALANDDFFGL